MKNIHLLPTEKRSRLQLFKGINEFEFELCSKDSFFNKGVHIYITSDEEIKKGDYVYSTSQDYDIQKVFKGLEKAYNDVEHYSKIILTTDQDLINDGVQEVDDEFLEWFVKNPKCEFIEVIEKTPDEIEVELNIHGHDIGLTDREFDEWLNNGGQLYKIIIPKERQKQYIIDMMNADEEIGLYEELKQETLEEAAEKYSLELLYFLKTKKC